MLSLAIYTLSRRGRAFVTEWMSPFEERRSSRPAKARGPATKRIRTRVAILADRREAVPSGIASSETSETQSLRDFTRE